MHGSPITFPLIVKQSIIRIIFNLYIWYFNSIVIPNLKSCHVDITYIFSIANSAIVQYLCFQIITCCCRNRSLRKCISCWTADWRWYQETCSRTFKVFIPDTWLMCCASRLTVRQFNRGNITIGWILTIDSTISVISDQRINWKFWFLYKFP